jgi:hypothetical protein
MGLIHGLLVWLQNLPFAVWVAESDSIWGFAFVLFVHAVGMGMTAGIAFVVCLRLLGVGRTIPVSSLRVLFRLFWWGFYINLVTGFILFTTDATSIARAPLLYVKLVLLGLAVVTMIRLRGFIDSDRSDSAIPNSVRNIAVLCIALWLGVITAGRLIAYQVESLGSTASSAAAPVHIASIR